MRTLTPRQKTLLFLDLCPLSPAQKRKLMSVFREPGEILQKTAAGSPRLLALVGQNLYTEMQRRCNPAFFWEAVRRYEQEGAWFERLALLEECKSLPWSAVWDMFCLLNDVPVGEDYINEVQRYEREVTSKR